jgi:glycerol-3-phosphate acyltransferase PlsY
MIVSGLLLLAAAYLIGSVPIGLVVVRLSTGKNVLNEHSGRTGGTNVMRTAGFWAGLVTAAGDVLKGGAAVLLAQQLAPAAPAIHAAAGVLAVLGHNHSVFLMDRTGGRLRFRGGAGGRRPSAAESPSRRLWRGSSSPSPCCSSGSATPPSRRWSWAR